MRTRRSLLALLALALVATGCNLSHLMEPEMSGVDISATSATRSTPSSPSGLVPGAYYSFASDANGYSLLMNINKQNGHGTLGWTMSGREAWMPEGPCLGLMTLGFAFDLDGAMYAAMGAFYFEHELATSRLMRIEPRTGTVTYVGPTVPGNFCGADINSRGEMYVMGMDVPHLGYIHGDGRLYRVDKVTGTFTQIGPVDVAITDWMDLAFDSRDNLWGTTQNKLFRIDTQTGQILQTVPIHGVPGDPPPPGNTLIQEVMSIAFDDKDQLYGTAMNVEWDTGHGSPVMKIDTQTGMATVIGFTDQTYNHGGDIMPTSVSILHNKGNGGRVPITVAMSALTAHLAHGDVVPGAAGVPWDMDGGRWKLDEN